MFKQISVEEFEHKALVLSEEDALVHSDNVVRVIWVFYHQELEKLRLLLGKLVVNLSVSVDFDGHMKASLVVDAADHLGKAAFAEHFDYFKAVQDLVFTLKDVVAILII